MTTDDSSRDLRVSAAPHCGHCVYLHVLVFDLLTGGDAVGDVQVDELWRKVHSRRQPRGGLTTEMNEVLLRRTLVVSAALMSETEGSTACCEGLQTGAVGGA